jgi:hypothetical protein
MAMWIRRADLARRGRRGGAAALLAILATVAIGVQSVAAAGWSSPDTIIARTGCFQSGAVLTADGVPEAVATCDNDIYQFEQRANGWTATQLTSTGSNLGVQIAIDGSSLSVAYSSDTVVDACAAPSAQSGVFVRSRALPDGAWSAPRRIGVHRDVLQAFDVADGHLHAAVTPGTGGLIYETDASGTLRRYALPGGNGLASLSVGSDGRARIAYEATTGLRVATFTGHGFHWQQVPGTTARDGSPAPRPRRSEPCAPALDTRRPLAARLQLRVRGSSDGARRHLLRDGAQWRLDTPVGPALHGVDGRNVTGRRRGDGSRARAGRLAHRSARVDEDQVGLVEQRDPLRRRVLRRHAPPGSGHWSTHGGVPDHRRTVRTRP